MFFVAVSASSRPTVGLFLFSVFAGASLLMGVSLLATIHFWRKAKPGVTVASFVLDTRPSEEPDLSGWRWGRLALASWIVAAAISGVFCILYAFGIRA